MVRFDVGDVVQLKIGGPQMIVKADHMSYSICIWASETAIGEVNVANLHLVLIRKNQPAADSDASTPSA